MKRKALSLLAGLTATPAMAATVVTFDSVTDTTYQAHDLAAAPVAGGPTGSFGRITPASNSAQGRISVARADVGNAYNRIDGHFDFRAIPNSSTNQADGFSFAILNTANYGTGTANFSTVLQEAERARYTDSIGFGINIHDAGASEPSNNTFYLSYNTIQTQIDVNTVTNGFDMSTNEFHRADFTIDFVGGNARVDLTLTQDINGVASNVALILDDYVISGVTPYEYRVGAFGRTGGQNADQQIDNIFVQSSIPEPSSALICGLVGIAVTLRRRKRT